MNRRRVLVVVSERGDADGFPDTMVVSAQGYIEGGAAVAEPYTLIVNLCRTLGYGSDGYYVSLLADARGQQVLPRLETSAGVADPYARFRALEEAGITTVDDADSPQDDCADIVVCLGTTADPRFHAVAAGVFGVWPAPLLSVRMLREDSQWKVAGVVPASPLQLDAEQRRLLVDTVTGDMLALRRSGDARGRGAVRASIAVLLDPLDPFSASSPETVDRLQAVAAGLNVHVARIGADELRRLPEYDALFIRSLTGVTLPSFQFALRAEALDMPVIDDSQSIIRCGNKVFLEELLRREGVPLPRTRIVTAHTPWPQLEELGLPFVIKSPDGAFSAGVHRIETHEDYETRASELLVRSPLLIAQEWLLTEFDWRITVLGGRLLFAARYYMAHGHWQIRTEEGGVERYGKVEAVPREEAPPAVVDAALRAARLIGQGMYGVDLKETDHGPVVIEVNDNPNLDADYEDAADGDIIYEEIINHFVARIEEEAGPGAGTATGERNAGPRTRADRRRRTPAIGGPLRRRAAGLVASRREPVRRRATQGPYGLFEVAGLELEYPTVDENLDVVALVEPAFRTIAGRGTSDIELDRVGFSNEIADHVFEVKTIEPLRSMRDAEDVIVGGIRRFTAVLEQEWNARLLPTAMHPWFDPMNARLWTRSGLRIYTTYARIFDIRTHGWMNVHATHLNLPFGDERETIAMHTAAALLLPYLPAVAASSPVHDSRLQPYVDARLAWILQHQSRIPETCGRIVPEIMDSFASYRREILQPMYGALDQYPHSEAIRHEFLNSRGAVLRFARRALEVRVLDTQECVRMDIAIGVFVRAALQQLTREVLDGRIVAPSHDTLVADFEACIRDGTNAAVCAPHFGGHTEGGSTARDVLRTLMERARTCVGTDDAGYLALVDDVIAHGSLAERMRMRLAPYAASEATLRPALRDLYGELADCLVSNQPWAGRR